VRAAVLALLAEQPMHGYEMITEIEDRSGGFWRPSAGSIYPTLQLLEDEGLIVGEESEGKRRFTLTEEGKTVAADKAKETGSSPWEQVRGGAPPELVNLGRSVHQLRAAVGTALKEGSEEQRAKVRELLDDTRRRIYTILSEE
jgi:DNA-binding PadR family transcriptional regulator